jgi:hypothetical protein
VHTSQRVRLVAPVARSRLLSSDGPVKKAPKPEIEKHVTYFRPWYRWLLGMEVSITVFCVGALGHVRGQNRKSTISDNALDMFTICAGRLEADPEWARAVTEYNKNAMYSWFQSTVLHVWLCLGRMYSPAVDGREIMSQEMSEHLFAEVERRLVRDLGITNPIAFTREYKVMCRSSFGVRGSVVCVPGVQSNMQIKFWCVAQWCVCVCVLRSPGSTN